MVIVPARILLASRLEGTVEGKDHGLDLTPP